MSAVAPLREAAFDSLYREHRGNVYSYTLSHLRNVDDAEDATQTTFLNAYKAIERGHNPELTEAWLIAIARNVCRQRFRDAKRRPVVEPLDLEHVDPRSPEPRISAADIRNALINLPSRQRTALVMRELEGRSHGEICAALGVGEGALQALLSCARRSVRERLDGHMTCKEARRAIKRQYGDLVSLAERRLLMSHLRECASCAAEAGHRPPARNGHVRTLLGLVPFPGWLPSIFGGGGSSAGTATGAAGAVAGKLFMLAAVGTTVAGVTWGVHAITPPVRHDAPRAPIRDTHSAVRATAAQPLPTTYVMSKPAPPAQRHETRGLHSKPRRSAKPTVRPTSSSVLASSANVASASSAPPSTDPPSDLTPVTPNPSPASSQPDPVPPADGGTDASQAPDLNQPSTATSPTAAQSQPPAVQAATTSPSAPTPPATSGGLSSSSPSTGNTNMGRAVGPNGTPPGQAKGHGQDAGNANGQGPGNSTVG